MKFFNILLDINGSLSTKFTEWKLLYPSVFFIIIFKNAGS
ncbi:MAG: hypothetical protein HLUCCX10_10590 [Algoriphagus marincola HL-49]|uniref:Uncharacterized protein n=1 Tax=Algoriphagus marincola HL-49 TaxID=1305737 RepID=A0A0P7XFD0_9BACT|nr:MAG: hypothetical protein HLUCCX10_10590 [Algoriphagus marincola HL-49]